MIIITKIKLRIKTITLTMQCLDNLETICAKQTPQTNNVYDKKCERFI